MCQTASSLCYELPESYETSDNYLERTVAYIWKQYLELVKEGRNSGFQSKKITKADENRRLEVFRQITSEDLSKYHALFLESSCDSWSEKVRESGETFPCICSSHLIPFPLCFIPRVLSSHWMTPSRSVISNLTRRRRHLALHLC